MPSFLIHFKDRDIRVLAQKVETDPGGDEIFITLQDKDDQIVGEFWGTVGWSKE